MLQMRECLQVRKVILVLDISFTLRSIPPCASKIATVIKMNSAASDWLKYVQILRKTNLPVNRKCQLAILIL
jgi:hypothetical protein